MSSSVPTAVSKIAFSNMEYHSISGGAPSSQKPHAHPIMTVQPPREEDLQQSYASVVGKDPQPKGFYGAMSASSFPQSLNPGSLFIQSVSFLVLAGPSSRTRGGPKADGRSSTVNSLGICIGTMGAVPCCFCCPNPYKEVSQGNVGLVTKFGRFYKAIDPGLVKVNPLSERLIQIDVKIQTTEVPQQVCMTKDNVSVHLTSVIYYHIVSPHKVAFGISNVRMALIERTQTTLRQVIGARVLQEVIERREEVAHAIGEIIEDVAAGWGVKVESMLIKDIIFSQELQESLSMAAQSKRIGESKIIAAKAEVEAAKLMRKAADILSSAPAMQIRYLEAMQAMAKTANSKVIFLPAANQTFSPTALNAAIATATTDNLDFGSDDVAFQSALKARMVENI